MFPTPPPVKLWRLPVDRYHQMLEVGIYSKNDRIELLDGYLVHTTPRTVLEADVTIQFAERLDTFLGDDWIVCSRSPVTLATSEPEPDLVVVRGPEARYDRAHPHPKDISLVVEVADSSLDYDRRFKNPVYAAAKIPTYWIVSLPEKRLEVYASPKGGKNPAYRSCDRYAQDDRVPVILKGERVGEVELAGVFG